MAVMFGGLMSWKRSGRMQNLKMAKISFASR
jgi:hypothetical protein